MKIKTKLLILGAILLIGVASYLFFLNLPTDCEGVIAEDGSCIENPEEYWNTDCVLTEDGKFKICKLGQIQISSGNVSDEDFLIIKS